MAVFDSMRSIIKTHIITLPLYSTDGDIKQFYDMSVLLSVCSIR